MRNAFLPDVDIISPEEFDFKCFREIGAAKRRQGNQCSRRGLLYKDIISAFDIETTAIDDIEQSVLYLWQWSFNENLVVIGRDWESFRTFFDSIQRELDGLNLVVYVHNLSYEFHFLRGVIEFDPDSVFCVGKRKILKAVSGSIEYRCSYLHSNMGLDQFMKKCGVEAGKVTGFDYTKKRFPWTPLDEREIAYGVQDVSGLVKALKNEMRLDDDSLYTIPLTSTGYVRRDAKKAMRFLPHSYYEMQIPDYELYLLLRRAFRGGNCHASRFYSGQILEGVRSADRSSSYPDNVCNDKFPVSRFFHSGAITMERLADIMNRRGRAVLARVIMRNLRLADPRWPCPYLSLSKCHVGERKKIDNGRILECGICETVLTDVDLRIVLDEYTFDSIEIVDSYHARYGRMPEVIIDLTTTYYRGKTELKGDPSKKYFYDKYKAKLNAIYGLMAQDPGKARILYHEFIKKSEGLYSLVELNPDDYAKATRRAFMPYQWGVWCTSLSRFRLEEGIRLAYNAEGVGDGFVYADTDSVKYLGEIDWTSFNTARKTASELSGACAVDARGKTHYMGVFEDEGVYDRFITWGAKKYAYEQNGKIGITVSGVVKSGSEDRPDGGRELESRGGLEAFRPGFAFTKAGGTETVYNDKPEYSSYEIDGHKVEITPNVLIRQSSYTLNLSNDYASLLSEISIERRN